MDSGADLPIARPEDLADAGRPAWDDGPCLLAPAYPAVGPDLLRSLGREVLLLDIDGTLGPHGLRTPSAGTVDWIADLRAAGVSVCVVSNAGRRRVEAFCAPLGIPFLARAGKPSPKPALRALAALGATPDRAAFLGDQLYTDVACARRAGVLPILVRPVPGREPWNVLLKRRFERAALRRALGADGARRFLGTPA